MRLARDLPLTCGLMAGSLVGSQESAEGLGVVVGVHVLCDGEGDGDPGGEDEEIGDELAEGAEDSGDEFGHRVDEEEVRAVGEEDEEEREGRGFAQRHEIVGEDGWADEVLLGEIAGGDDDGAAVVLEDGRRLRRR